MLITKKGEHRPIVDLEGKYYVIDDLDTDFVEKFVNKDAWSKYAGRYVKNAYDENLTDKDETLDISICMDLKAANKAFKIESTYTAIRIAGVQTNPCCIILLTAGSYVQLHARRAWLKRTRQLTGNQKAPVQDVSATGLRTLTTGT